MVCVVSAVVLFLGKGYAPMEDGKFYTHAAPLELCWFISHWLIELISSTHIMEDRLGSLSYGYKATKSILENRPTGARSRFKCIRVSLIRELSTIT